MIERAVGAGGNRRDRIREGLAKKVIKGDGRVHDRMIEARIGHQDHGLTVGSNEEDIDVIWIIMAQPPQGHGELMDCAGDSGNDDARRVRVGCARIGQGHEDDIAVGKLGRAAGSDDGAGGVRIGG